MSSLNKKDLFHRILASRGLDNSSLESFLSPNYQDLHDPFLLPDMAAAVDRLLAARQAQEKIVIYGDYDIDGLTATTLLVGAFEAFGFEHVDTFIPNRFVEGYGLTVEAVEKISADGADLIITVDCGSLSRAEIERAGQLGVDVIVTDHHNVAPVQPSAVAVINPKRLLQDYPEKYDGFVLVASEQARPEAKSLYPFLDLAGVGVAFKLVQALQTRLDGLPKGQEKWFLDLVALGTVCDVVTLQDENRIFAYWGIEVLKKTRRVGLRALLAVAGVEPAAIDARTLGFVLGPRMNASGRLETARYAQDMLLSQDPPAALDLAQKLDDMNVQRRSEQAKIMKQALAEADKYSSDPVLVVSAPGWNHGIIGIVAAKLLEKFKKPAFVLQEDAEVIDHKATAKGSARSYGDFSAADAIRTAEEVITKGGGHKLAAGVTLPAENIDKFRQRINQHYRSLGLRPDQQRQKLLAKEDAVADLSEIDEELVENIARLEPFGNGNPQPIIKTSGLLVKNCRQMGGDNQHVKLTLSDGRASMDFLAFNAEPEWFVEPGGRVDVWYSPQINHWNGTSSLQGQISRLESAA